MIELGRYQGLAVEERVCRMCNVLENEEHFLTIFKRNEKRRTYIKHANNVPPSPLEGIGVREII